MTNGSADPLLDQSWANVRFDTADLGGASLFDFPDVDFNQQQVPAGGLGRYRLVVATYDPCDQIYKLVTLKTLIGSQSIGSNATGLEIHSGILADADPKPSASPQRQYLGLGRSEFAPAVPSNETRTYYQSVGTNANGSGPSIATALANLQQFRTRYFSSGKELVSSYYNKGDLGIGREMHCNFELPGERACYVSNYAPCAEAKQANGLCQKPIFNDPAGSFAEQLNGGVPFATVAMVERDAIAPNQPNSVFFAVYVCDSGNCNTLSNHRLYDGPVALDNHGIAGQGSNTFNPGNCMACHGTGGRYDANQHATIGGYFLPFDMDAFDYLSTNSQSPLSRKKLEPIMREMNEHVAESHLATVGNARKMIQAWYDGNFTSGSFVGARVPSGLGFDAGPASSAYYSVYGKACRGCHITSPNLQFSTWEQWQTLGALMKVQLCDNRVMPLAERTQDLAWEGTVRQSFFHHLGIKQAICNPQ